MGKLTYHFALRNSKIQYACPESGRTVVGSSARSLTSLDAGVVDCAKFGTSTCENLHPKVKIFVEQQLGFVQMGFGITSYYCFHS